MTKARTKQKDTNEPAFSPDGRYLYFSDDATPGDTFEYSKDVNGQIYVIQRLDRQTGEIETYVDGPGGAIRPTPSPDGKSLAFIRRVRYKSTLMLMDLEVRPHHPADRHPRPRHAGNLGGPRRLSGDELDARQQARSSSGPSGGIHRVDVASRSRSATSPSMSPARASSRMRCASRRRSRPPASTTKMVRFAQKSPDGSRIVYEALGHLWIADGDGGDAAAPDPRRRISKAIRPCRATGAASPMSPGTTTRRDGSRWSAPAAAKAASSRPSPAIMSSRPSRPTAA